MAVRMITGYAGVGHVTAGDAGQFNAGMVGNGRYVLETGEQFAYTAISNNSIQIASGDLINQGRHISIPPNTVETAYISNGAQGRYRIDIIVMRYSKDASTGVESAEIAVIEGTPSTSTPSMPSVTTGNIYNGARIDEYPLYAVYLNGISISRIETLFRTAKSMTSLEDDYNEQLSNAMASTWERVYPVGSIYMNVGNVNPSTLFGGTWQKIEGRFLLGTSTAYTLGGTGGEYSHKLSAAESGLPAHGHGFTQPTIGGGACNTNSSGTCSTASNTGSCNISSSGQHSHKIVYYYSKDGASGTAKNRIAAAGTSHSDGTSTGGAMRIATTTGAHTHTVPNHTHTVPNHVHSIPAHTHTATNGAVQNNTGAEATNAHNNMPPYLVVNIWKRTA